jgi:hypothetical protein
MASKTTVAAARAFPAVPLVVLRHGISFDPGGDPVPALVVRAIQDVVAGDR